MISVGAMYYKAIYAVFIFLPAVLCANDNQPGRFDRTVYRIESFDRPTLFNHCFPTTQAARQQFPLTGSWNNSETNDCVRCLIHAQREGCNYTNCFMTIGCCCVLSGFFTAFSSCIIASMKVAPATTSQACAISSMSLLIAGFMCMNGRNTIDDPCCCDQLCLHCLHRILYVPEDQDMPRSDTESEDEL